MAGTIEDMGANLFLRFFIWQVKFMVKGIIRLIQLPFELVKLITDRAEGDKSSGSEKPSESK